VSTVIVGHTVRSLQGNFFVDEKVLRAVGQTNFDHYAYVPGTKEFWPDFFIEEQDGMCAPSTSSRTRADIKRSLTQR
jgi:hypothetical protein